MQRRTYLIGAASAVGGIGFLATQPAKAQQDIEFGDLQIPNESTYTGDQAVQDILLNVDAVYQYESDIQPDSYRIVLSVGTGTASQYPIDEITEDNPATTSDGTVSLSGSILETPAFSEASFALDSEGAEASTTLVVQLTLGVTTNGEELTTTVQTAAELTVQNGSPTINTKLGGTGEIEVEMG